MTGKIILDKSLDELIKNNTLYPTMVLASQYDKNSKIGNPELYVGSKLNIVNKCSNIFGMTGLMLTSIDGVSLSMSLGAGREMWLQCVIRSYNSERQIGWLVEYNGVQSRV